ncbi:hypothetical protein ACOME3_005357 [Neoechinorhynchus agilis]
MTAVTDELLPTFVESLSQKFKPQILSAINCSTAERIYVVRHNIHNQNEDGYQIAARLTIGNDHYLDVLFQVIYGNEALYRTEFVRILNPNISPLEPICKP